LKYLASEGWNRRISRRHCSVADTALISEKPLVFLASPSGKCSRQVLLNLAFDSKVQCRFDQQPGKLAQTVNGAAAIDAPDRR
jgi:hypothetical protein